MQLNLWNEERPAWEVLDGEPHKAFSRFERYRLLGPERSIAAAYREVTGRDGRPSDKWYQVAERWRWKERAEEWDHSERERSRREYEQRRQTNRKNRIALLTHAHSKIFEALQNLDVRAARWSDVLAGLKIVTAELRTEYGDDPRYREDLRPNDAAGNDHSGSTEARERLLGRLLARTASSGSAAGDSGTERT